MKKVFLTYLFLLTGIAVFAQKEIKDANAEVRTVSSFHAIKVSTGIELLLTQGSSQAVAVSASSSDYRANIKTEVKDGVLNIYYDNPSNVWRNTSAKKLKAYVSVTEIDGIQTSAGAHVKTDGTIKSNKLSLTATSGSGFSGSVDVTQLIVKQNSGSDVNISGTAGTLDVSASSGSGFHGYELATNNCTADVSSGAGVQTTVQKELKAEATSGGYINYKGDGVIRDIRTGSGGHVSKK